MCNKLNNSVYQIVKSFWNSLILLVQFDPFLLLNFTLFLNLNFLRVWVWILTILYVIQAIIYFIGAISFSANIDEVESCDLSLLHSFTLLFFHIVSTRSFTQDMRLTKRPFKKHPSPGQNRWKGPGNWGACVLLDHHSPWHDRFYQRHWSSCVSRMQDSCGVNTNRDVGTLRHVKIVVLHM